MNIFFSVVSFAPWLPSRGRDLSRVFKLADLKNGQTFYDLGCGDGRVIIYASRHYQVKAVGLEISLPLYLICRFRQLLEPNHNLVFKLKNLFKEDLSTADVVYFFGTPPTINKKLVKKLRRELKRGAKVISYSFKINDWPAKIIDKPNPKAATIYLYEA